MTTVSTAADDADPSARITQKIAALDDWRGAALARVRRLIHAADPKVVETWKWQRATSPGTPVWEHDGIVCTGETYKQAVKLTFARGAALADPDRLFNASLDGNVRRAIDLHQDSTLDEAAFTALVRSAVAANVAAKAGKRTPDPNRPSAKRAARKP